MFSRPSARNRLIAFGVLLVVLVMSDIIYGTQRNSFAPVQASDVATTFTNPEVLQNWLPENSYAYTVARINDYLRVNGIIATSMTVQGDVTFDTPTYDFTVSLASQKQPLHVVVIVTNDSAVVGTTVIINGQQQDPAIPTSQNSVLGSTSYNGFDALISAGLTAIQSNELQQALRTFAPSASSISVDTTSVQLGSATADGTTQPLTFTLNINGKTYSATLNAIGLLRIQLYLYDSVASSRPVFNSGIISQGS